MGSSFAAGPGISPRTAASPRRAGRSSGNYAHLVARPLGLDLHDVTYSGATTGDILRPSTAGQPAQLNAVTPDTRLVTITAGRQRCRLPAPAHPGQPALAAAGAAARQGSRRRVRGSGRDR
jgi:hypothetical protein